MGVAARSTAHALLREAGRFLAQNYSDVVDDDHNHLTKREALLRLLEFVDRVASKASGP